MLLLALLPVKITTPVHITSPVELAQPSGIISFTASLVAGGLGLALARGVLQAKFRRKILSGKCKLCRATWSAVVQLNSRRKLRSALGFA